MAARTPAGEQGSSRRFSSALSSAALEWLLMVLLFLDAFFSYLVTKFARKSKLQTPCLICSRLDHILGNEKPGFYKFLICEAHKLEISSLAYCHVHRKLADVHEMCEGCLLSFATEKKSNPETYRSLIGILGVDLDDNELQTVVDGEDVVKVPLLEKNVVAGPVNTRHCSCCSKSFKHKAHISRLLQSKSIGAEIAEVEVPLASSLGHSRLDFQDALSNTRERSTNTLGFDQLAHIGYSELKITSDSESEVPLSDDYDGNMPVCATQDLEEDAGQSPQPEPVIPTPINSPTTILIDMAPEKLIHPDPDMMESSLSVLEKPCHVEESQVSRYIAEAAASGHSLEELNWNQIEVKADPPNPPASSDIVAESVPSGVTDAKLDALDIVDGACVSATAGGELSKALSSAGKNLKTGQIMVDPTLSVQGSLDLNDAYKLAIGSKGSLTSPNITEVVIGRDSFKVHEDLRLLLSQISAARGLEFPWNDMSPSPRVQGQVDEFKFSDASSSAVLQNITKRLSLERNESGLESLDGSIVSEIEGESPLDRLKRQIELDRKSINILYKELEEERNASAIAVNQAMAMINRLQEEKAAMQMEALQYQRMMEDQAEYDQEALQKSNELLTQREKEIKDLEAKLESYRKHYGGDPLSDRVLEQFGDFEARENNLIGTSIGKSGGYNKSEENEMAFQEPAWSRLHHLEDRLLDFEDEKCYISECLKKLERKLHLFSNNGVYVDLSRSYAEEDGLPHVDVNGINNAQGCTLSMDNITSNGQDLDETAAVDDLETPYLNDEPSKSTADSHAKTSSTLLTEDVKENYRESPLCFDSDVKRQYSMAGKKGGFAALEKEISHLNERLETLEADRNFLEHAINSLRNGSDGVRFIQEIACDLRELRRIGISRRENVLV